MSTFEKPTLKLLGYISYGAGRSYYLLQVHGGDRWILLTAGAEHYAGVISAKEAIASLNHLIAMINDEASNIGDSRSEVEYAKGLTRARAQAKATVLVIEGEFGDATS